jgi:hypothetical protein
MAGSLIAAAWELARYKLDLVCRRLGGTKGAQYKHIIIFSMEKETKITNREQDLLYTTEQYQQLQEHSLLVIGCDI